VNGSTNTITYHSTILILAVKSFIIQAPDNIESIKSKLACFCIAKKTKYFKNAASLKAGKQIKFSKHFWHWPQISQLILKHSILISNITFTHLITRLFNYLFI